MIYLFEDDHDAPISEFMRIALDLNPNVHCAYSKGAPLLISELINIHKIYPKEFIYVFCDLIPDNYKTRATFDSLWQFICDNSEYHNKVFINPSFSMEYYYLLSLKNRDMIDPNYHNIIEFCLTCLPYKESAFFRFLPDAEEIKNHEKFCKYLCKYAVEPCASTLAADMRKYMTSNCYCNFDFLDNCAPVSLLQKSSDMLGTWYYFCVNNPYSRIEIDSLCNLLLDECNRFNNLVLQYTGDKVIIARKHNPYIDLKSLRRKFYGAFTNLY